MSIEGIRDAIQTGLKTIPKLNAYDNAPDSINPPCAFPIPKSGGYDFTAGNCYELNFEVVLLLGRQGDLEEIQENLDDYIAPTGIKSIKAAIEAADFGSHADTVRVSGFRDYGGIIWGGITYIGCKFDMHVLV
jgi:hypothetical protein